MWDKFLPDVESVSAGACWVLGVFAQLRVSFSEQTSSGLISSSSSSSSSNTNVNETQKEAQ